MPKPGGFGLPKKGILKKPLFIALCSLLASGFLSFWADGLEKGPSNVSLSTLRSLSPASASSLFFGQRRLLADVYWIRILQYCGNSDNARHDYSNLLTYCLEAVTLDPQFDQVYYYGSVYLAWYVRRTDEASKLLRRGLTVLRDGPVKARLQLYLAAIQYQSEGRDVQVLSYLVKLVQSGEYPPLLPPILANTLEKLGDLEGALEVWQLVLDREPARSKLRDRALKKISELQPQI